MMHNIEKIPSSSGHFHKKRHEKDAQKKTGADVAMTIKDFIRQEYPQMPETHAMKLAILLTKEQIKGNIG